MHLKIEEKGLLGRLATFPLIHSPNVQLYSGTMKCISSQGYTQ